MTDQKWCYSLLAALQEADGKSARAILIERLVELQNRESRQPGSHGDVERLFTPDTRKESKLKEVRRSDNSGDKRRTGS